MSTGGTATPFNPPPYTPSAAVTNINTDPTGVAPNGYDADGYPLPPKGIGYDPNIAAPVPSSEDPHYGSAADLAAHPLRPGETMAYRQNNENLWQKQQRDAAANLQAKQAWQQQHAGSRQAAPVAPAAPTVPFQSSGVDLTKQGKGENYADSILQHYQQVGVPGVGNNAQSVFDQYQRSQPQDMSAYYNNAERLQDNDINKQMAARGQYGSSSAIGQIAAADTNLRAQQARDEAQYGLQRYGVAGSLAGAADTQGNTANGIQFQWTKGLNDIANNDQQAGQDRNQQLWTNNLNLANIQSGIVGNAGAGAIADTTAATDAAENAAMGQATDASSAANANANRDAAQTTSTLNSLGTAANTYAAQQKYIGGQF